MNIVAIFIAKWDEQNDTKIIKFEHCFGLLKRKPWFMFRFNNPKQCSNWIILVSFYSSHRAIKMAKIVFDNIWQIVSINRLLLTQATVGVNPFRFNTQSRLKLLNKISTAILFERVTLSRDTVKTKNDE